MSTNWPAKMDVYRKWVLNEHGWYCGAPWNLPIFSFSEISNEDFFLQTPRQFLPCISTNTNRQSLGIYVDFRCAADQQWHCWPGPVWVSKSECAVYLGGDCLSGDFFQAAVLHQAQVRVTASVKADAHLKCQIPGDSGNQAKLLQHPRNALFRKVHSSSIFFGKADLGSPLEIDDSVKLDRLARNFQQTQASSMQAHVSLAWINTNLNIGDSVSEISGRQLDLAGSPHRKPAITQVRHDYLKHSTHLVING